MSRSGLVHVLTLVAVLLAGWALILMWTGGLLFHIGDIRISSRTFRNPAILAFLILLLAWLTAPPGARWAALGAEYRWLAGLLSTRLDRLPALLRRPSTLAVMAAIVTVVVGVTEGAFVVAVSDSYGYVSQAHLWTTGSLLREPPLVHVVGSSVPIDVLSPLGYRPTPDGTTIAPTYSAGLPMVQAVFEMLAGPGSVYWVVPILTGGLVWVTYLLGARAGTPLSGALAAILVAASPPLLYQLTLPPMSDLPAAAWWSLSILLVSFGRLATLGAGVTAGLAFLTRPNLAPLIVVVGGLVAWRLWSGRRSVWLTAQHLLLFAVGIVPACLTFLVINDTLWGSPFTTGYGSLDALYGVSNIPTNAALYPVLLALHMPAMVLLPFAVKVKAAEDGSQSDRTRRMMRRGLGVFAAVVLICYLPYPMFDASWNLRFLLPAIPALLVLTTVVATSLGARVMATHWPACLMAVIVLCGYGINHARHLGAFDTASLRRASIIGDYIARRLPERAVVFAWLHSGTVTFYSGRQTLRFDLLAPDRLDALVDELQRKGYDTYLVLDWEDKAIFQERFKDHSRYAALDWPALAIVESDMVALYDLRSRQASTGQQTAATEVIPWR